MNRVKRIGLVLLSLLTIASVGSSQMNMEFVANVNYDGARANDIWGYVGPDNTEYALVGLNTGVSVVSLADPANAEEIHFVSGINSGWRDIKTHEGYAYVINESGNGLQVIDLTMLPDSVSAYNWEPTIDRAGTLSSCHNIYIDEFGFAYLSGCNLNAGGLFIADVTTTPGSPEFAGFGSPIYSHDVYVRDNIAYSSEISDGQFSIYDVTDKSDIVRLGGALTDFTFTHNAWLSDDSKTLFTTDERANAPVGAYDISDFQDIKALDQFKPQGSLNTGVIPHNAHVLNDFVVISYYSDGCVVIDGSRPHNLIEVGNYDTYADPGTGFNGAWGAYPFLPSGLVLISDRSTGLYVVRPEYKRACWLEGNVTDMNTGQPITGAKVEILDGPGDESTDARGDYFTGYHQAGTYTVRVTQVGYVSAQKEVEITNGEVSYEDFELESLPRITMSGNIVDPAGVPITEVMIQLVSSDIQYETQSDGHGIFSIDDFIEGSYEVFVAKWGYVFEQVGSMELDADNPVVSLQGVPGYEDKFNFDLGWEVFSSLPIGAWERATPITETLGFILAPLQDVEEDLGNSCYVTYNQLSPQGGVLVGNSTTLVSPEFDLTAYERPILSFYEWYIMGAFQGEVEPVPMTVEIFNGRERVALKDINYNVPDEPEWRKYEIDLAEVIELTERMSISITANAPTSETFAEGGIDYFQVLEADATSVDEVLSEKVQLVVSPNPSADDFVIRYNDDPARDYVLRIYDVTGALVISEKLSGGNLRLGSNLIPGVYFGQVSDGTSVTRSIRLVKI